jgi:DNA-binding SARP family transcriptional activator
VEVRLAGSFGVRRDDTELAGQAVGSRKSRLLLKLLAVERPALVPVDRIADVLWAGQPPPAAPQNIATLVSRLRGVLGTEVIAGGRAGYRLAGDGVVSVDLDAAARYCDQAERKLASAPALALAAASRAAGLLDGGTALADEPDADWAAPARAELTGLLRRARLLAAQAALAGRNPHQAAEHAAAAMAADPFDEAAHRWFMSAAAAAGEPARALAAYAALRERLAAELGTDPAPQTQELHLAILREEQPGPGSPGPGSQLGGRRGGQPGNEERAGRAGRERPGWDRRERRDVDEPRWPGPDADPRRGRDEPGWPARDGDAPRGRDQDARRGPGRTSGRATGSAPGLVGRDAELAALRELWSAAAGGAGQVVMIVGEAGIGKTTLARALADEAAADGGTVLRARCYEAERSLFLQPVAEALQPAAGSLSAAELRELLGEYAGAAAALLPDVAALLGPVPAGAESAGHASAEMERRRVFEAVTAFLTGLAGHRPVLLLIDDLQYAGQSTAELIHYLGRQADRSRLLVLVTVRAEQDAQLGSLLEPVATRLELGPLGLDDVTALARSAGQADLAVSILLRTRGHPLFIVEVLRGLAAGFAGVPESLRGAVQARVRRAGTAVDQLLRAAAVLGSAVDPALVGALLELTPAAALQICGLALEARLLTVSGREYEFANDLIREALYETTPAPARLAYHRRAADLLTGRPEALARHAAVAGDWPRAARAWLFAAEEAMARYAASDAVALATQAIDAAEHGRAAADEAGAARAGVTATDGSAGAATTDGALGQDGARMTRGDAEVAARALLVRGRAREAAGESPAALADLTRSLADSREAGDRRLEMLVLRELGGDVPVSLGQSLGTVEAQLTGGLRIAQALGDQAAQANLLSRLTVLAATRLRLDEALDLGRRAAAAGRAAGDEQALAEGLDGLKTAYLCQGDAAALAGVLAELDPLLRRHGDLFRLQWSEFESAFVAVAAADWDRAAAAIASAIEVNRRGGYPYCAAWYVAHQGWLAGLRGHDAEALAAGRRALALALAQDSEHAWWVAATCAMLSETVLRTGDRAAAIALLERGLTAAQDHGAEAYLVRCVAPLAALTGSRELLAEAAALLDQAATASGAWITGDAAYLAVARAWIDRDDPERARATLAPLLAVAERVPWTATLAAGLVADGRALGRLGETAQARSALRRASELAGEHGLPHIYADAEAAAAEIT